MKRIQRATVMLFTAVVLLAPVKAFAFSYADLLIATDKSQQLCESRGSDSAYCDRAKMYAAFLATVAAKKTDAEKQQAVDAIPVEWRGTLYTKTIAAWDQDVKDGKMSSGSSTSSRSDNNNCPDGSVRVSVSLTSNGDNCVGNDTVNPIYAYLKGVIVFLGGAIGLAVVITIIVAGIQYSSSAGNPANITKAKERLTNAVIGLVLYLFLAAILRYLVPQIFP